MLNGGYMNQQAKAPVPGADRFPVGSRVKVLGNGEAEVLRHGSDLLGDYTEVRHTDGTIRHYHRNWWLSSASTAPLEKS